MGTVLPFEVRSGAKDAFQTAIDITLSDKDPENIDPTDISYFYNISEKNDPAIGGLRIPATAFWDFYKICFLSAEKTSAEIDGNEYSDDIIGDIGDAHYLAENGYRIEDNGETIFVPTKQLQRLQLRYTVAGTNTFM